MASKPRLIVGDLRPFSNGTEYMVWQELSCDCCRKASPNAQQFEEIACPIERAMSEGTMLGAVPRELAVRGGWSDADHMMHECPELERKE